MLWECYPKGGGHGFESLARSLSSVNLSHHPPVHEYRGLRQSCRIARREGANMSEHVVEKKLFHLTETKPYKKAFIAKQQLTVGDKYNPFFGFYEGAREYDVAAFRRIDDKLACTDDTRLS